MAVSFSISPSSAKNCSQAFFLGFHMTWKGVEIRPLIFTPSLLSPSTLCNCNPTLSAYHHIFVAVSIADVGSIIFWINMNGVWKFYNSVKDSPYSQVSKIGAYFHVLGHTHWFKKSHNNVRKDSFQLYLTCHQNDSSYQKEKIIWLGKKCSFC